MATKAQVKSFIQMIAPIAQRQAAKHGNRTYVSVCIAQACCESSYGTAPKMIRANAVFGIKVGKTSYKYGTAWKGKGYSTSTREVYSGVEHRINDCFRAYDSIEDSVEDYFDLLCKSSRYKAALDQPTPLACIQGIQKAPYATDPDYIPVIMNIIKTNNLTQYDPGNKTVVSYDTQPPTGNPYQEPDKLIRLHSRGNPVRWLQYALNTKGYKLIVDGYAGELTIGAVMDFQRASGLKVDGIVGPLTRAELNK